ncbi:MAG: YndJ family transporter, partial [Myxococcaceae bacterium]
LVHAVMAGFGATAALALIASRLEVTLFEIPEPIVKLTALHFSFAGVGSLSLANRLVASRASAPRRISGLLVMVAPPLVAIGFITRLALFQVGGAVVMAAGVCAVAALQVSEALKRSGWARALFLVSSASPWIAMGLGVAWAANQYWPSVPALTVPDMVPTHGALNAFGFVLAGHLAWWLDERGW